jgi:LmbE family N-acetylglucosaminyl deacetylase
MATRRLLISLAHPDDESFGLGALIARYVAEGVEVYLLCATNGDVGTVSPEMLNGYKSVAELRLAELDCAAQKLGFKKVFRLGYKDSGMMSSETSNDPQCLWQQWQSDPAGVTRRVVEIIREVQPQVVITFNRYGGYGHPDHIAIQRATVQAFRLANNPTYVTDGFQPYQPHKLYYNTMPTFLIRLSIWMLRLRGKNPRKMGRNHDVDVLAILENNRDVIHTKVAIRDYYQAWDEASACHASQGGGRGGYIPRWLRRVVWPTQSFSRVYPEPNHNRVDEYDLFAGVGSEEPVSARFGASL